MTNRFRNILVFIQINEHYSDLEKIARLYLNRFTVCESNEFEIKVYHINDENSIQSGLYNEFCKTI